MSRQPLQRNEHGEPVAVIVLNSDITERKLAEQELLRSNEDLERFVTVASHDLFEPLRTISRVRRAASTALSGSARRGGGQVPRLHGPGGRTHAGADRRPARLLPCQLGRARARDVDTADDVLRALEAQIAERGTRVKVDALPTLPAEPALLRHVFQNLIANAVKFTDGEQPQVRISASHEPGRWRFDVEDNAPGIEPHQTERVFECSSGFTTTTGSRSSHSHPTPRSRSPTQPRAVEACPLVRVPEAHARAATSGACEVALDRGHRDGNGGSSLSGGRCGVQSRG